MGWLCNEEDVSTEIDLNGASRETLLEIIETQQKVIAELRNRVEYLERIISSGGSAGGMPGNKPNSRRRGSDRPESRKSPKQRPHGFARRRMEPTRRVTHAAESCFECGTALAGGWVHRRREVVEVPLAPAEVVEHVFVARMCALCRKRRLPDEPLRGQAVGRRRFGVNLLSLIVTLREEGRLPIRAIQQYLQTVHQLKLSAGAIVEVIHGVARQAQSSVAETLERVRASAVVHADETGWRQDGVNGYVWTFSTPTERYFVRGGRNKEVVDEVLGDCFSGVLVSDFYAAYNHYPGLKQRCWAHLLRDVDDLQASYPQDTVLARWATAVHRLYRKAKAAANTAPASEPWLWVSPMQLELEERLLALCRPYYNDQAAPQARLCRRIRQFIKELFVFVSHPQVPPDNNQAERSLRHLVVSRKISGGTRSSNGTKSKMALASLFGAWRAKGLNPYFECRNLLASH